MGEQKTLFVADERCLPSMFEELGRNARTERDRSLSGFRLRRVDAGPHPRLGNTKVGTTRIGELDLAPPEPEDLPPPEPGRHY